MQFSELAGGSSGLRVGSSGRIAVLRLQIIQFRASGLAPFRVWGSSVALFTLALSCATEFCF